MAVLNPLKVIIDNYPKGQSETLEAVNNPDPYPEDMLTTIKRFELDKFYLYEKGGL